jgi:uncharacterized protein YkwD
MSRPRVCAALVWCLGVALLAAVTPASAAAHASRSFRARSSAQCAYANTRVGAASSSALRSAVVCLINQQRETRGLPGLRVSGRLNGVAERHTQAMVGSGVFSHGADFSLRFSQGGYNWRAAGENIATGYATPLSVVDAWMASPDHCRNILSPMFRDVGTGVAPGSIGGDTGPGTWTQDFGLLMSQSAPSRNAGPENGCPY